MVSIDSVYQKVLTLTNKEQRGYITPQEFNLLANQAQMEIFEQYFYDMEQWGRRPGNEYSYSDMVTNIEEKISRFQSTDVAFNYSNTVGGIDLVNAYKLGVIKVRYAQQDSAYKLAEQLTSAELARYEQSPLTKSTFKKPCYVLSSYGGNDNLIARFYPAMQNGDSAKVSFITRPLSVSWGYVVVQGKALYDPSPEKTINFELHESEEVELVYKILRLAGVTIQRADIVQAAQVMEAAQIQQEKQ
tara:strand:- start:1364 stop:2098 length:735 start_codon:yes stop_codon:yes gene_type:complete